MEEHNILAEHSYRELTDLLLWFYHQGPIPVLIGGWAVFCYSSYMGSVDIDLVGPSMGGLFDATLEGFERERGYQAVSYEPMYLGVSFRKPVYEAGELVGYVEIDACTYEDDKRVFKEDQGIELPYSLCSRDGLLTRVALGPRCEAFIPDKALLFLYKLKALRDRQFDLRVRGAVLGFERAEWLRSKIVKDASDLISLLDPNPDPCMVKQELDLCVLERLVDEFQLHFCIGSIESLPSLRASRMQYKNVDETSVRKWVSDLISQIA